MINTFFFLSNTTCFMERISSVIKYEVQLLIIRTNTPLTFEFISWICIDYGKLFLITEADALKARLDGIKGQRGREWLAPSLVALAHFHYQPPTKTSIALCINSLKAPLFAGLLNTFFLFLWDVIAAKASHQVNQTVRALMMTTLGSGFGLKRRR